LQRSGSIWTQCNTGVKNHRAGEVLGQPRKYSEWPKSLVMSVTGSLDIATHNTQARYAFLPSDQSVSYEGLS